MGESTDLRIKAAVSFDKFDTKTDFVVVLTSRFGYVMTGFILPSFADATKQITNMIQSKNDDKYLISSLLYNVLIELLKKCDVSEKDSGMTEAINYVMEHYREK